MRDSRFTHSSSLAAPFSSRTRLLRSSLVTRIRLSQQDRNKLSSSFTRSLLTREVTIEFQFVAHSTSHSPLAQQHRNDHHQSDKMRLLTHNQLICIRKNCKQNYPLTLKPTEVEQEETECRQDFIEHLLPTVDYAVLRQAAVTLGLEKQLPLVLPAALQQQQQQSVLTIHSSVVKDRAIAAAAEESASGDDADASSANDDATMTEAAPASNSSSSAAASASTSASEAAASPDMPHDELMQNLHQLLLDTIVLTGELHCPGCKRVYRVQQGIPNMRLNEDEV